MMIGFMGAAIMALWIFGFKLGWAWGDRILAKKKRKPAPPDIVHHWVKDEPIEPPQGGLFISETEKN